MRIYETWQFIIKWKRFWYSLDKNDEWMRLGRQKSHHWEHSVNNKSFLVTFGGYVKWREKRQLKNWNVCFNKLWIKWIEIEFWSMHTRTIMWELKILENFAFGTSVWSVTAVAMFEREKIINLASCAAVMHVCASFFSTITKFFPKKILSNRKLLSFPFGENFQLQRLFNRVLFPWIFTKLNTTWRWILPWFTHARLCEMMKRKKKLFPTRNKEKKANF